MANYIEKNTVEILRCSNWAMRALHDNLYEIIHSEKFDTHTQNTLNDLLERIDQNVYGAGCVVVDIMDFCGSEKNKIPLVLFYGLIE